MATDEYYAEGVTIYRARVQRRQPQRRQEAPPRTHPPPCLRARPSAEATKQQSHDNFKLREEFLVVQVGRARNEGTRPPQDVALVPRGQT